MKRALIISCVIAASVGLLVLINEFVEHALWDYPMFYRPTQAELARYPLERSSDGKWRIIGDYEWATWSTRSAAECSRKSKIYDEQRRQRDAARTWKPAP